MVGIAPAVYEIDDRSRQHSSRPDALSLVAAVLAGVAGMLSLAQVENRAAALGSGEKAGCILDWGCGLTDVFLQSAQLLDRLLDGLSDTVEVIPEPYLFGQIRNPGAADQVLDGIEQTHVLLLCSFATTLLQDTK